MKDFNSIRLKVLNELGKSKVIDSNKFSETFNALDVIDSSIKKFLNEIENYKNEIIALQNELKNLRLEKQEIKTLVTELESRKLELDSVLDSMKKEIGFKKIINNDKKKKEKLKAQRESIIPASLKSVDIYLKDGSIGKAKPAQKIFDEEMYMKYRVSLKENHALKAKNAELELEKKKLEIELRDFYKDLTLSGMGAFLDSSKTSETKIRNEVSAEFNNENKIDSKTTQEILKNENLNNKLEFKNNFKQILESKKD